MDVAKEKSTMKLGIIVIWFANPCEIILVLFLSMYIDIANYSNKEMALIDMATFSIVTISWVWSPVFVV